MAKLSKNEKREMLRAMGLMSQIGFTIVVCVAMGLFFGRFLDNILGASPWLLIVFTLLGCFSAIKALIDLARKF
ncbi:MAG: AtpZ/AtpI family protein [Defluviitaleaceae bacterium]|nr:AtpZ/AtpI family protein [Defluviitaleaceae bacterium]